MSTLMGAIPISKTVKVTPSAITSAGGVSFINGLILTNNTQALPAGKIRAYGSSAAVATDFTPASIEAQMASVYFSGFRGTTQTPSTLYFYSVDPASDADPASLMKVVTSATQSFTGFTTSWEPTLEQKQAFATWTSAQSDRYWYVPWDTDEQALDPQSGASFGAWLKKQSPEGTTAIYKDPLVSALCLGWMASLDFSATNGRTNLCFRRNGAITPAAIDGDTSDALIANGYSFYGANANGLGDWQWVSNGAVSGQFLWADSYINQVWLNASFQSDLINLLLNVGQIPYNTQGDGLISAAVQNTINQAVSFGAIRPGVALTDLQKQQIDGAAGTSISGTVESRGWYFQPNASSTPASVRIARGSPPCRFWYTDGQSVQSINLASLEVQ
ncbi:DUF3383 family protein [Saccharibacter floricola]|nr:DUF3383 family protein [Saccharibacter floricola]